MNNKNILITLMALAMIMTSCMKDDFGGFDPNEFPTNISSVITLTTDRFDGIVSLSVDASENSRAELWIDLDGDGIRADNGSENIKVFNQRQDYRLAPGLKTVSIYGGVTYLACASNELTAIDVSGNPYLTALNVPLNRLTALDVSKNSALTRLDCSDNRISTLDVSKNRALISLWSFNNQLSVLDLSNNADLVFLDCSNNQLTSLDVSRNNKLMRLVCYNNQLTSLNISNNDKLNRLWLFGNSFSAIETERIVTMVKELGKIDLWIADFDNM